MTMTTKRRVTAPRPSAILRNETYHELKKGAPVRIEGEPGKWEFLYHCVNTDTGSEWLDVFGGTPGAETLRAFKAERVIPIRPKYTRGKNTPVGLRLEDLI